MPELVCFHFLHQICFAKRVKLDQRKRGCLSVQSWLLLPGARETSERGRPLPQIVNEQSAPSEKPEILPDSQQSPSMQTPLHEWSRGLAHSRRVTLCQAWLMEQRSPWSLNRRKILKGINRQAKACWTKHAPQGARGQEGDLFAILCI